MTDTPAPFTPDPLSLYAVFEREHLAARFALVALPPPAPPRRRKRRAT